MKVKVMFTLYVIKTCIINGVQFYNSLDIPNADHSTRTRTLTSLKSRSVSKPDHSASIPQTPFNSSFERWAKLVRQPTFTKSRKHEILL